MRVEAVVAWVAALAAGAATVRADVPEAVVLLEAFTAVLPHQVPEAAPVRFALLEEGEVYVGGSREVVHGVLPRDQHRALLKRVESVRKLPGLAGRVEMGPGDGRFRLVLRRGRPIDMTITGDPDQAGPAFRPLAALLRDLLDFHAPGLRPYRPAQYSLRAREGALPGGCRRWTLPDAPSSAVFAARAVPATAAEGWPTGVDPAAVCAGEQRYVVTFRPLLPGETP